MTVEEFIYDLLELNVSTVIKMSSFESVLEKVLPIESWKAGKVCSVSFSSLTVYTYLLICCYDYELFRH